MHNVSQSQNAPVRVTILSFFGSASYSRYSPFVEGCFEQTFDRDETGPNALCICSALLTCWRKTFWILPSMTLHRLRMWECVLIRSAGPPNGFLITSSVRSTSALSGDDRPSRAPHLGTRGCGRQRSPRPGTPAARHLVGHEVGRPVF